MPTQVQFRRGTSTENDAFTGAVGEISFDTTNNRLRVHDGSTQGGYAFARIADFTSGSLSPSFVDVTATGEVTQGSGNYLSRNYVVYGNTTDATETELLIGGSTRIPVATDSTIFYEVNIACRRTDQTGESAAWQLKGIADNFSGSVSDVGDVYEISIAQDDLNLAVDVRADDTNNALGVHVTGVAAKSYRWIAHVKTVDVNQ